MSLNNLDAARACTVRLRDTLLRDAAGGFEPGSPGYEQIVSCVEELSSTAQRFAAARGDAVRSLASHLRPRLRTVVGGLLDKADKVGSLDNVGFNYADDASYERARHDPNGWAAR